MRRQVRRVLLRRPVRHDVGSAVTLHRHQPTTGSVGSHNTTVARPGSVRARLASPLVDLGVVAVGSAPSRGRRVGRLAKISGRPDDAVAAAVAPAIRRSAGAGRVDVLVEIDALGVVWPLGERVLALLAHGVVQLVDAALTFHLGLLVDLGRVQLLDKRAVRLLAPCTVLALAPLALQRHLLLALLLADDGLAAAVVHLVHGALLPHLLALALPRLGRVPLGLRLREVLPLVAVELRLLGRLELLADLLELRLALLERRHLHALAVLGLHALVQALRLLRRRHLRVAGAQHLAHRAALRPPHRRRVAGARRRRAGHRDRGRAHDLVSGRQRRRDLLGRARARARVLAPDVGEVLLTLAPLALVRLAPRLVRRLLLSKGGGLHALAALLHHLQLRLHRLLGARSLLLLLLLAGLGLAAVPRHLAPRQLDFLLLGQVTQLLAVLHHGLLARVHRRRRRGRGQVRLHPILLLLQLALEALGAFQQRLSVVGRLLRHRLPRRRHEAAALRRARDAGAGAAASRSRDARARSACVDARPGRVPPRPLLAQAAARAVAAVYGLDARGRALLHAVPLGDHAGAFARHLVRTCGVASRARLDGHRRALLPPRLAQRRLLLADARHALPRHVPLGALLNLLRGRVPHQLLVVDICVAARVRIHVQRRLARADVPVWAAAVRAHVRNLLARNAPTCAGLYPHGRPLVALAPLGRHLAACDAAARGRLDADRSALPLLLLREPLRTDRLHVAPRGVTPRARLNGASRVVVLRAPLFHLRFLVLWRGRHVHVARTSTATRLKPPALRAPTSLRLDPRRRRALFLAPAV
mmetsp:Transcript_27160/g.94167  ORF Transcript_27160/g.94167 Transcript_27160/m.94167 type:complete len:816 (-) Transcript_27160:1170-3617(-)